MIKVLLLFSAIFSLSLAGCGGEVASHATVEMNRQTAKENSEVLGKAYAYAYVKNFEAVVRGRTDSTVTAECPMGDGWTSVDLVDAETGAVRVELKCSTISPSIGCMPAKDFKARPQYNEKEGRCDRELPHPLPKLAG